MSTPILENNNRATGTTSATVTLTSGHGGTLTPGDTFIATVYNNATATFTEPSSLTSFFSGGTGLTGGAAVFDIVCGVLTTSMTSLGFSQTGGSNMIVLWSTFRNVALSSGIPVVDSNSPVYNTANTGTATVTGIYTDTANELWYFGLAHRGSAENPGNPGNSWININGGSSDAQDFYNVITSVVSNATVNSVLGVTTDWAASFVGFHTATNSAKSKTMTSVSQLINPSPVVSDSTATSENVWLQVVNLISVSDSTTTSENVVVTLTGGVSTLSISV